MQINHVYKSFDTKVVLQDISHTFQKGITLLRGVSGEGKTTLLRIIAGLELPDKGEVVYPVNRKISMVFQEDRLLPYYTGEENIAFVMGDRVYSEELAKKWGLWEAFDKKVAAYSGGMKRRIAMIRALSVPFDILLLDEPFTGLDEENKEKMFLELKSFPDAYILLVTHDNFVGDDCLTIKNNHLYI